MAYKVIVLKHSFSTSKEQVLELVPFIPDYLMGVMENLNK